MNRVLLIDDNSSSREARQRHFSSLGFSVMSVGSFDADRAMDASPDFVLLATTAQGVTPRITNAWVYQLHDGAPPELRAAASGAPNENTLFWHRRLQRALIGSMLGIRTLAAREAN